MKEASKASQLNHSQLVEAKGSPSAQVLIPVLSAFDCFSTKQLSHPFVGEITKVLTSRKLKVPMKFPLSQIIGTLAKS